MVEATTHDDTARAPGELELLQRFLNLHAHDAQGSTVAPDPETIRAFLVDRGLLEPEERFTDSDRETALELRDALRNLIAAHEGEPLSPADAEAIDRAGVAGGLHPHFHADRAPTLEPQGASVAAAFARLVAIAFLASFDGRFEHLKLCAAEDCRAVFYDRSKNHSGKWCSMAECGNRAKVRAWRERQRAGR